MKNFKDNEDGVVMGAIYLIITIATALLLIIAVGPLMHFMMGLYDDLDQSDTIFVNSDSGWNGFISTVHLTELTWEMSFMFFIAIAVLFMIFRSIRKQTYTQTELR